MVAPCKFDVLTTVFVDKQNTRGNVSKLKFPSVLLLTDQIKIHQLQPLVWPSNLLYVMLSGCDWWISIRSVNITRKTDDNFGNVSACVLFSKVSTKAVVKLVYFSSRLRFLGKYLFWEHQIFAGRLSADNSSTETLCYLKTRFLTNQQVYFLRASCFLNGRNCNQAKVKRCE